MSCLRALLLATVIVAPAAAQSPPPTWDGRLTHQREWFSRGEVTRSRTDLRLARDVGSGAVSLDLARLSEPSGAHLGLGLDAYFPVGDRAEGFVRVAGAPEAASSPRRLAAAQFIRYLPGGWRAEAGSWYRDYEFASLVQAHLGAGWRRNAWEIGARAGAIRSEGETLPLGHVRGRRYLDEDGHHVEFLVAARDEVLDFLPRTTETELLTTPTLVLLARGEVGVGGRISLVLAGGVSRMQDFGTRTVAEAGLAYRW